MSDNSFLKALAKEGVGEALGVLLVYLWKEHIVRLVCYLVAAAILGTAFTTALGLAWWIFLIPGAFLGTVGPYLVPKGAGDDPQKHDDLTDLRIFRSMLLTTAIVIALGLGGLVVSSGAHRELMLINYLLVGLASGLFAVVAFAIEAARQPRANGTEL